MQGYTTKELHVVVDHIPLDFVSTSSPFIMIDGLITVNGNEIVCRISGQLTVEIRRRHDCLLVFGETTGSILHDTESCRHNLIEGNLIFVQSFLLKLVNFVKNRLAVIDGGIINFGLEFLYSLLLVFGRVLNVFLYFLSFGTQLVIAQSFYFRIFGLHLLYKRLNELHVPRTFIAKQ